MKLPRPLRGSEFCGLKWSFSPRSSQGGCVEPDLSTGKHRAKPRGRKGQSGKSRHSDAKCLLQLTKNSLLVHQTAVVSPALQCCGAVGPAEKILPFQGHRDSPASLTGSSRTGGGLHRSRCRCWLLWLSRDVFWAVCGCLVEEHPVFGERWGKVLALRTAGSLWKELSACTPPRREPRGALDLEGLPAGNPCGNESQKGWKGPYRSSGSTPLPRAG